MDLTYVFKQAAINQVLGFRLGRSLADRISNRPALKPPGIKNGRIWGNPYHPDLPMRKLHTVLELLGEGASLEGKTVLEVGPGMTLGMGLAGIALGARQVILVDREQYVSNDEQTIECHRAMVELIPDWFPNPDPRLETLLLPDGSIAKDHGIEYLISDVCSMPLADSTIDLSVSHSTLEHVEDMDLAMSELARVTKPGGFAVHQVGLGDHLDHNNPLRMLYFSEPTWHLMASNRRGWANRLRMSDYFAIFKRTGFVIEDFRIEYQLENAYVEEVRPKLHAQFQNLPANELGVLSFTCVLRRSPVPRPRA